MKMKIEKIVLFLFLTLFSIATIYPVLNILSVSMRTDNAFQTRSLSIIQFDEPYTDINKNNLFDDGESFIDKNDNGRWDSGSSLKSYLALFLETDFLLWTKNSICGPEISNRQKLMPL